MHAAMAAFFFTAPLWGPVLRTTVPDPIFGAMVHQLEIFMPAFMMGFYIGRKACRLKHVKPSRAGF
jgi:hypothetical protein